MRSLLSFILNIIWFLTAGWTLFLGYALAGILACLLIFMWRIPVVDEKQQKH